MSLRLDTTDPRAGLRTSLSAALSAGGLVGLIFGAIDATLAATRGTAELGVLSFLGCLAASVLLYGIVFGAGLVAVALFAHAHLRSRGADMGRRYQFLLRVGLGVGIFAEAYWWSRPFVFPGRSSIAPERLAACAVILVAAFALAWWLGRRLARTPVALTRVIAVSLGLLWFSGALYLFFQEREGSARGLPNERNRDLPNVLLVVSDALRADMLGCYGNTRVKTPNIDALAAQGALFENHFTQAPFTWTSFGSLLTGKYPRRHGLVSMQAGYRMVPNITLPWHFKSATKKDGSVLRDEDVLAATFHTGTLSTGSGLLRGFDQYFEALAGHELVSLDSNWSVFRSDLLLFVFKNKLGQRLDAGIVASTAREWLVHNAKKRFVAMVHLYSTHTPYDPPERFRALYCDPAYSGPVHQFYAQDREKIEQAKSTPTAADIAQIRALYEAGVSQADSMLGDLVSELARQGVLDDTVVIFTSDHGESLGEQGLWEHDHMVQTNLRIPLLMRCPKLLAAGKRVSRLSDEIDVLPTICDLAGLELPHEAAPFGTVDGTSLLPLVRGEVQSVRPFSFAENGVYSSAQDAQWKLIVESGQFAKHEPGDSAPIAAAPPRLFHLPQDPGELRNVHDESPREAERLLAALRAWRKSLPNERRIDYSPRDLENEQRRLKLLGYTDGVGDKNPVTPKDKQ